MLLDDDDDVFFIYSSNDAESVVMCSYNGQEDGRVGLYVAAEPLKRAKSYFEVEIIDAGVNGTISKCLAAV